MSKPHKVIQLILASNSQRRKELLMETRFPFTTIHPDFDEQYPNHLKDVEIVDYIVHQKANKIHSISTHENLILVADTIVWDGLHCLGKPENEQQAFRMLQQLSGQTHKVITGVGFLLNQKVDLIHQSTEVTFKPLEKDEILYYIESHTPFDKAGSYGIQEWIGSIGVDSIKGSYTNVVGLPLSHVYEKLKDYATRFVFD
ncbi:MAG: Maf family nucleotide pyrophosphatase [Flavobacteriaceae bacterium]|nr:Maf family nucleotide pyrophosphatase [Flavobacteriaceae bacterium]MCY4267933.1 Maf family nucleotide pyrophosphatase [Flavobacteriaceae bacterium]MCY4298641.1 Maf family nucleotide pyrophosphatase [Flavobacteriaceae bacterium]